MPNNPDLSADPCAERSDSPVCDGCAPLRPQLCEEMHRRHSAILGFCETLEAVADSLPSHVDRHACLRIAESLLPLMREAHAYEEANIFPAYASDTRRRATIHRLMAEHVEDEAAAEDLTERLLNIGHGGLVDNPEVLGLMLRGLFEGMRRHVAFEREHVMPLTRACRPE